MQRMTQLRVNGGLCTGRQIFWGLVLSFFGSVFPFLTASAQEIFADNTLAAVCAMDVSPQEVATMNQLLAESLDLQTWQESQHVLLQAKQYLLSQKAHIKRGHPVFKPAVVFDLDETLLDNRGYFARYSRFAKPCWDAWALTGQASRLPLSYELYQWVINKGYTVFFISGRSETLRKATEKNLSQLGYSRYRHLYLKPLEMQTLPTGLYKARVRHKIQTEGFVIQANVGDQQSDLEGGYFRRGFKLPNKLYTVK
ncbi:MAG: HAD family acid phosphatase [Cyanobacteria bacterium]|nr:HAD family acid phosphatase [Cyanobacteriota bacterium]